MVAKLFTVGRRFQKPTTTHALTGFNLRPGCNFYCFHAVMGTKTFKPMISANQILKTVDAPVTAIAQSTNQIVDKSGLHQLKDRK